MTPVCEGIPISESKTRIQGLIKYREKKTSSNIEFQLHKETWITTNNKKAIFSKTAAKNINLCGRLFQTS